MIGGNIDAIIQIKHTGSKNAIGEQNDDWLNVLKIRGWLDFSSGEAKYNTYKAKVEESSHIFVCDYQEDIKNLCYLLDGEGDYIYDSDNCTIRTRTFADGNAESITSENARMFIKGRKYDIVLIDNPMELNQHYEFYLKAVGQDG